MSHGDRMRRVRTPIVILILGVLSLLGPGVGRTYAVHSTTFAANAAGVAVTPSRFLVVRCSGSEVEVLSVAASGALFAFAQTPASDGISGCLNPAIAIAPSTDGFIGSASIPRENAAGFKSGFAYVTQTTLTGTTVWQADLSGTLSVFLTVACADPLYADLAFQTVEDADPMTSFQGPFGAHGLMFVTCTDGKIRKVSSPAAPVVSVVIDLLTQGIDNIQGPSQAPQGFSFAPGALCVSSPTEGPGRVFCVTGSASVLQVGDTWSDTNGVDFLLGKCTYEPGATGPAQGGTYYVSTPAGGGTIFKYLPAAFSGLFGNAGIVTRAGSNQPNKALGKLTADTTGRIVSFDTHPGTLHRDAAAVDCSVPTIVLVDVSPGQGGGNVIQQGSQGNIHTAIVGSAAVPATAIVSDTVRCGFTGGPNDAAANSVFIQDVTGPAGLPDGILDWVGGFTPAQMNLPPAPSPYRGPIVCRGTYNVGSDPVFDGGG